MKRIILILYCIVFISAANSQEWIRVYGDESSAGGKYVIETYDKGYIFLGPKNSYKYAWIVKTDINGNILWNKRIGNNSSKTIPNNIVQTNDMGYIFCGGTSKWDPYSDAFIQKLDVCGEPEWCKVFNSRSYDYESDYGQRVKQLSDGGYLFLTRYLGKNPYQRIHLTKFDENGSMVWQHVYVQADPGIFNEEGWDLTIVNDNRYLITGWCYYPDPGDSIVGWRRPLFIMTDSLGEIVWEKPWVVDGYYVGSTRASVVDSIGNIYTAGKVYIRDEADNLPALIKTSPEGDELYYNSVIEEDAWGICTTIEWINDSTLFMTAGWEDNFDNTHDAFLKVDTLGNLIDSLNIIPPMSNGIYWTIRTFDGKYVSVGTDYDGNWDMYGFKVNENMEYDSIYTKQFVYDSLCNDSITSETYDLKCDIVTDIDEPFTTAEGSKMKIYPNPATDVVNFSLPEYIITESKSSHWHITRVNYKYHGIFRIEIHDTFGRKVKTIEVPEGERKTNLNVSELKPGLYVAALFRKGKIICKGKFLIVR